MLSQVAGWRTLRVLAAAGLLWVGLALARDASAQLPAPESSPPAEAKPDGGSSTWWYAPVIAFSVVGSIVGIILGGLLAESDAGVCGEGESLITQRRTCPPSVDGRVVVVRRECCVSSAGARSCERFPACPPASPS